MIFNNLYIGKIWKVPKYGDVGHKKYILWTYNVNLPINARGVYQILKILGGASIGGRRL